MKTWYVYKITCSANGKGYIGITVRPRVRWWTHLNEARLGKKASILHVAMKKHGPDAFRFDVIAECFSAAEAVVCERAQIAQHGTFYKTKRGYNMTLGGAGLLGLERPEEFRQKMRAIRKGFRIPQEAQDRMRATMIKVGHKPPVWGSKKAWDARRGSTLPANHAAKVRSVLDANRKNPEIEARRKAATLAATKKKWADPFYRAARMAKMVQYRHLSDDDRLMTAVLAIVKSHDCIRLNGLLYSESNHDRYYY